MNFDEYRWEIDLIKERYASLQLNDEQAWQVHLFEEGKMAFTGLHFFSDWEEWDYERSVFEKILSKEQFDVYVTDLNNAIERYVQTLPESDRHYHKQVAYMLEVIQYYEDHFLPALHTGTPIHLFFRDDKPKIDYLKASYKQHWLQARQQSLISHFRAYRLYMPTALQYTLLQQKLAALWPSYTYFRNSMDAATRAVDDYLRNKVKFLNGETDLALHKKMEEKARFFEGLHDKYYKDDRGGWHVVIGSSSPEEEKIEHLMTVLLVDKDLYNFPEMMIS
jgi:hypothetical protein